MLLTDVATRAMESQLAFDSRQHDIDPSVEAYADVHA